MVSAQEVVDKYATMCNNRQMKFSIDILFRPETWAVLSWKCPECEHRYMSNDDGANALFYDIVDHMSMSHNIDVLVAD